MGSSSNFYSGGSAITVSVSNLPQLASLPTASTYTSGSEIYDQATAKFYTQSGGAWVQNVAALNSSGTVVDSSARAVVASANNSNGTYTKFADGTMICRGNITVSSIATGPSGGLYYSSPAPTWTFPAAFTVEPVVVVSAKKTGATSNLVLAGGPNTITTSNASAWALSTGTGDTAALQFVAVGKWY